MILKIFRVDTNSTEAEESPSGFFGTVRPYYFQYNQTAVLSPLIYHSLGCFDSVRFFRNFHLIKGYVPAFLSVFGLRKVVSKLKVPFSAL